MYASAQFPQKQRKRDTSSDIGIDQTIMTRFSSKYFISFCSPLRERQSFITAPIYSFGQTIVALAIGCTAISARFHSKQARFSGKRGYLEGLSDGSCFRKICRIVHSDHLAAHKLHCACVTHYEARKPSHSEESPLFSQVRIWEGTLVGNGRCSGDDCDTVLLQA